MDGLRGPEMVTVRVEVFLGNVCRACDMDLTSYRTLKSGQRQACVKPYSYKMPVTIEASTLDALCEAIIRFAGQIAGVCR